MLKFVNVKSIPMDVQTALVKASEFCGRVQMTGGNLDYAASYLNAIPSILENFGIDGLKTQILYILENLRSWRGDDAQKHKEILRRYAENA